MSFKLGAVQLVLGEGYSVTKAAERLEISPKNLHHWKRQYSDGLAFETYVRQGLCLHLRPRQIVVLDQLGVHKRSEVHEAIQARGYELAFPPSYSPDLTPSSRLSASSRRSSNVSRRAPMRR